MSTVPAFASRYRAPGGPDISTGYELSSTNTLNRKQLVSAIPTVPIFKTSTLALFIKRVVDMAVFLGAHDVVKTAWLPMPLKLAGKVATEPPAPLGLEEYDGSTLEPFDPGYSIISAKVAARSRINRKMKTEEVLTEGVPREGDLDQRGVPSGVEESVSPDDKEDKQDEEWPKPTTPWKPVGAQMPTLESGKKEKRSGEKTKSTSSGTG